MESELLNKKYVFNRGKLADCAFAFLPLGSVKAKKWLEHQLVLQRQGITGHMEEYPDYSEDSAWLGGSGENWERGPYYVRGLVALAYSLNDSALKSKAKKWIDWSLDNQDEDGFWGPESNKDWWPRMPMMMAIRDYYEANGEEDSRVLPFFEKYFRYQLKNLPLNPLSDWGKARGGDNLDSIYWYYNRVFDSNNPESTDWLLDLANLIVSQTDDWRNEFTCTTVRKHVVNTSQALKMPVVYYQQSKSETDRNAFWNAGFNWNIDHGRIDGLPNSDEAARDNKPTRGSELCGIVENMLSTEIAMRITGNASYGDHLEKMAYNNLPNGFTYDLSGHTYYILQNQVMAVLGNHDFDCDHGDSSAFGAPAGFDCCFANGHMGWPKFVQNMWMATPNGGLALTAYGPNEVKAFVRGEKTAVFRVETDYPFREDIRIIYDGEKAQFPLFLRMPKWCEAPDVKFNGEDIFGIKPGEYLKIEREFNKEDTIDIRFSAKIELLSGYNASVAVKRGALIYSLRIAEDWRVYAGSSAREIKFAPKPYAPLREVYPGGPWNYGLVLDENAEASFEVVEKDIEPQPFCSNTPPVILKALGQRISDWILDGNKAGNLPFGYVEGDLSKNSNEKIELIPYGAGRLKITHFPVIGNYDDSLKFKTKYANSNFSEDIFEFENITVPFGTDYKLKINYSGNGEYKCCINGKNIGTISFKNENPENQTLIISGIRNLIEDESFMFTESHYNNITFYPLCENKKVIIKSIEISVLGETREPLIEKVDCVGENNVVLRTNIDEKLGNYRVYYKRDGDSFIKTAYGFKKSTAVITGLKPGAYSFFIESRLGGALKKSGGVSVEVGNIKKDAPKAPAEFNITGNGAYEALQIEFPKIEGADSYKIYVGENPGKYNLEIYEIKFNSYKNSEFFDTDKIAIGGLKNGQDYYVRISALKENSEIALSGEIKISNKKI